MKPLYSNATRIAVRQNMHLVWEAVSLPETTFNCHTQVHCNTFVK